MLWTPDQRRSILRCCSRPGHEKLTLLRQVADGLDVVAVRIEHEGAVIILMVVGPWARPAIVLAACRDRCRVKSIDGGASARGEANVRACLRAWARSNPEKGLWLDAIAAEALILGIEPRYPQGTQRAIVELPRPLDVADAKRDVIQHIRSC